MAGLSYDMSVESAAANLSRLRESCDEEAFFALLALEAFQASYLIVHQRDQLKRDDFIKWCGILEASRTLLEETKPSPHWPKQPCTFGQFHRAGDSALHVAIQFVSAITSAVMVAKLLSLGMPEMTLLSDDQIFKWMQETRNELETKTLDLEGWSRAKLLRDKDLLMRQIQLELASITQVAKKLGTPPVSDGPCEPNTWSQNGTPILSHRMPRTAYALVDYLWHCEGMRSDIKDTAGPVFGEAVEFVEMSTVQNHAKLANNFFRRTGLPWSVTTSKSPTPKVCLINEPPKTK